jgi:hypothetical protein
MSSLPNANFPQHPHPVYAGDEVDLRQLVRAVWRYRWVVAALGILGGLAGLGISQLSTRYVAEGLFLTPSLTLDSYKRYEAALGNEQRLLSFIKANGLGGTQTEQQLLRLASVPGALAKAIRPAFSLTASDAKAFGIETAEASGKLLGVTLRLERAELTAETPILQLAEYVRHTMIEVDLADAVLNQCLSFRSKEQELRSQQIQSDFSVLQLRERAKHLRELIAAIPGASSVDNRQVISLEGGGERYLSPTAQLVAIELGIGDAELEAVRRERDRQAVAIKKEYYCAGRELQKQAATGMAFLDQLAELHDKVLSNVDSEQDVVEQTAIGLSLERQAWVSQYIDRSRYVAAPEGAEQKRRNPGRALGLALGGVMGGLLGLLFALGLAWWHDNRESVLAADGN